MRRINSSACVDVQPQCAARTMLLWLLLLCSCLTVSLAQAQYAEVKGTRVFLPVVEALPYDLSLELRLLPRTKPQELQLVHSTAATAPLTAASAYYEGDLVIVPEVWIKDVSYWAELLVLGNGRFRLQGFGRNSQRIIGGGAYQHEGWEWIPGVANDIGVGADGTVWAVGASQYGYDYGLYRWDGQRWYEQRGSAVRVDVDPQGRPWVVNQWNEIYYLDRGRWRRVAGYANDIGVGADGSVWVIGDEERRGGYTIYRMGNAGGWIRVEGAALRIDVDRNGIPWVVNADNNIFRFSNGTWRRVPGKAKDIGIGADGSVWVIGTDERAGGYGIYRYNGVGWDRVSGSARHISVGPEGAPWVVTREGDIYSSWGN